MKKKRPPNRPPPPPPERILPTFIQALTLVGIPAPPGFYDRLWTPPITLWYFIWQGLRLKQTLEAVLTDARRGGADALSSGPTPLSQALRSKATTAYAKARQRLPLDWVRSAFTQLSGALLHSSGGRPQDLPVELLDGSTKRLRPYGDIADHFPAHRTRRQRSYWCVARVVVSFCAATGLATAALLGSLHLSEQALAVQLILERAARVLYVGDRNFGVWRVVRAAFQSNGQALVRLTKVRARSLLGKKHRTAFLDLALRWSPTSHDQADAGLLRLPVPGRLVIIQAQRKGYRAQTLYLFTTLTDGLTYPPQRLLQLYGWRWQVELDYRTLKSTMQMDQSETKSADMVRKEFYAGLMAYNLVRSLMSSAAEQSHCPPTALSFTKIHGLLAAILTELFMASMSRRHREKRLQWLLAEAAAARLPRRRKPRPHEPRAQYYTPQVFPKMKVPRDEARAALKKAPVKS
jgi:hypothetical protein